MLIRVYYAAEMSVDAFEKALTCRRCEGQGHERFDPSATCPNCLGDGDSRDNGWTYIAQTEWKLKVGSRVIVPPTPKRDENSVAIVIGLDSTFKIKSRLKHAVGPA